MIYDYLIDKFKELDTHPVVDYFRAAAIINVELDLRKFTGNTLGSVDLPCFRVPYPSICIELGEEQGQMVMLVRSQTGNTMGLLEPLWFAHVFSSAHFSRRKRLSMGLEDGEDHLAITTGDVMWDGSQVIDRNIKTKIRGYERFKLVKGNWIAYSPHKTPDGRAIASSLMTEACKSVMCTVCSMIMIQQSRSFDGWPIDAFAQEPGDKRVRYRFTEMEGFDPMIEN